MGSSPGRSPGRRIRASDLVCVWAGSPSRASRAGQKKEGLTAQSASGQWLAWTEWEMARPASRGLTPTAERKAWLRGSFPRLGTPSLPRHSPPCWALGTLQNGHLPCTGPQRVPMSECPSVSRTMTHQRGPSGVSHTSSPKAAAGPGARCPDGPTMSFPWE